MIFLRLPFIVYALLLSSFLAPKDVPAPTRIYDSNQTSNLPEIDLPNLGNQIKNYVKSNWRFAIKRIARELIHDAINKHYNSQNNKFFDGTSHTAVEFTLDNIIPSDDEDWIVSIFLAGALKYYSTRNITRAVAASALQYTRNYMMESFIAKKMGRDATLLNFVPFFSESLDEDEPSLMFNFQKGLENRLEYFLCWNDRTRIPSPFTRGSINDSAFMNFVSCALIPLAMESLNRNKMLPRIS